LKVLFGLPLRQTTGFVESLLELVGLDLSVPDFSTLCRRQKMLPVAVPYRGSSGPLHLLVDSTGIKAEGEGEWNARKHGGPKRRLWRKIHIGIDKETLEIRAIEITTNSIGDAPILPDLLNQIAPDQEIGSVTDDGADDTRKCHDAIVARNGHAVIPPRKNAKPWKPDTPGARARNDAVRSSKYLGSALWRNLAGYHRRSRIETNPLMVCKQTTAGQRMHCVKLLGQRVSALDFDRQVAEIQICAANLMENPVILTLYRHLYSRRESLNENRSGSGTSAALEGRQFVTVAKGRFPPFMILCPPIPPAGLL
jgi:hypothetical protein